MTFRAVTIGLLTGLAIAFCTYFNDWVVQQTHFVGNLMPISVFGTLILLYFIANPLLGRLKSDWTFSAGEMAIIAILSLAVCGWPGSNFFRTFAGTTAMPVNLETTNAGWQSSQVLSYVPGGSPQLAVGYMKDWPQLADVLVEGEKAETPSPASHIWSLLEPGARYHLQQVSLNREASTSNKRAILRGLNEVILGAQLFNEAGRIAFASVELPAADQAVADQLIAGELKDTQIHRFNRALLAATFPQYIAPVPAGEGVLLAGAQSDPEAIETLATGWGEKGGLKAVPGNIQRVPWGTWWPVLRLWVGVGLCLAIASLCLALIVHPQWSQRELLPYPLVRFLDELTHPDSHTQRPRIFAERLFWVAFLIVLGIHIVNGLHAWFPNVPGVKLAHSINALNELFPNARKVPGAWGLWNIKLYFSVIGFAFFLSSEVALSMGLTTVAWVVFGSFLISSGVAVQNSWSEPHIGSMTRFGGYLGAALMILYVGRKYYLNVLSSAFGMPRGKETPVYATWAARFLVLAIVTSVYLLGRYGGLSWQLGLLTMLLCLLAVLVVARIHAEAGAFFIQPSCLPMAVLAGVFGIQGLGPEAFIVIALASVILVGDPREAMMPYLVSGLRAGDVMARTRPATTGRWQLLMILIGLGAALVVTLTVQYNEGLSSRDSWGNRALPKMAFSTLNRQLSELTSRGELSEAMQVEGFGHFTSMRPNWSALGWAGLGLGLVVGCAVARLRLPWWPLHPVLILMWGTYPSHQFAWSFLLGWLAKTAVVKLGGSKSYQKVIPVAVGMIAAEILAAILWLGVGWTYFAITGKPPTVYALLPR